MNRHYVAALTTAAIVLTGAVSALPATASPSATVSVTPGGLSHHPSDIRLLTGSATRLAYVTRSYIPGVNSANSLLSTPSLEVRDLSGKITDLGKPSDTLEFWSWSMSGDYLIALETEPATTATTIAVFNLRTGGEREVAVPATAERIQATPTGFAYTDGVELRAWNAATGSYADLGAPFGTQPIESLVTDDSGLVVTGAYSGVKTMSFADPGVFNALNVGDAIGGANCLAVDAQGAACRLSNGLEFLPADGGAPTIGPPPGYAEQVVLVGDEVMWTDDGSDDYDVLEAFSPGNADGVGQSQRIDPNMIGAYGKAVFRSETNEHVVLEASTPTDITTVLSAPLSPETAGSFALAGSRVVYVSDLRDPADPKQDLQARSVSVHATGHTVRVGKPTNVGGRQGSLQVQTTPDYLSDALVAATDNIAAYYVAGDKNGKRVEQLMVATNSGTVEVPRSATASDETLGPVEAAGHRVLFEWNGKIRVYDVRTRRTQQVHTTDVPGSIALTNSHIAWVTPRGFIRWYDISSGTTTTIYSMPTPQASYANVVANGDHVAWSIQARHPRKSTPIYRMRDLSTGRVTKLAHRPYAMNADGVLLDDSTNESGTSTWFQRFDGGAHVLLTPRGYTEEPRLVGHALAWVSIDGNLKIAPYSY